MSEVQRSFAYHADPEDVAAQEDVRSAFRDCVADLTPKETCFVLNIQASLLSDALAGRDRKGIRLEWCPPVMRRCSKERALALANALARVIRGKVVDDDRPQTPEEKLAHLARRVRQRCGAVGAELASEVGE